MLARPKYAVLFSSQNFLGFLRYLALLKNRQEFANWLTRVVIMKFMFHININVAVGLEHKVLLTDFNYRMY